MSTRTHMRGGESMGYRDENMGAALEWAGSVLVKAVLHSATLVGMLGGLVYYSVDKFFRD